MLKSARLDFIGHPLLSGIFEEDPEGRLPYRRFKLHGGIVYLNSRGPGELLLDGELGHIAFNALGVRFKDMLSIYAQSPSHEDEHSFDRQSHLYVRKKLGISRFVQLFPLAIASGVMEIEQPRPNSLLSQLEKEDTELLGSLIDLSPEIVGSELGITDSAVHSRILRIGHRAELSVGKEPLTAAAVMEGVVEPNDWVRIPRVLAA